MSDFTDKVEPFLRHGKSSIINEEIANVAFTDHGFGTSIHINFRSGKTLEIEYDWAYKFRVNGEIVDHN